MNVFEAANQVSFVQEILSALRMDIRVYPWKGHRLDAPTVRIEVSDGFVGRRDWWVGDIVNDKVAQERYARYLDCLGQHFGYELRVDEEAAMASTFGSAAATGPSGPLKIRWLGKQPATVPTVPTATKPQPAVQAKGNKPLLRIRWLNPPKPEKKEGEKNENRP